MSSRYRSPGVSAMFGSLVPSGLVTSLRFGRNAVYLLTCSQLPFLHITQAHVARDCTAHQGLGPPISISDLQNTPPNWATGWSDLGNSVEFPTSQVTLGLGQIDS